MKKLLILFAFVPFLLSGQTPDPLVELAKYHDYNRLFEMADINFEYNSDEITSLETDVGILNGAQTIKAHITSKVDAAEADAWRDFTGFTVVANETDGDVFELLDDSTLICRKAGMYQFGGCVHIQNNTGGGFETYLVLSRVIKNSTSEAKCSQRGYGGDIRANGEDVLSYNGTDNLSLNDTIRLQYYTNNINTDFDSNSNFSDQVAATLWLTYIGKKD